MKRRKFLRSGAVAAGIVTIPGALLPLTGCNEAAKETSVASSTGRKKKGEIRSSAYMKKAGSGKKLPKPAVSLQTHRTLQGIQITPMPLAERIRRKIVPRKGFCSLVPGGDVLLSGNGAVSIEVAGNPYSERIPFNHESLFTPRRRPFEASVIAHILPKVRQMILDGKYHEAARFAYDEWHKTPITRGMGGFGGGRFSLLLEYEESRTVSDYLRTVDFESTEVKVHWTDERGKWVRRVFASRPDNVVVQWLTPPSGVPLNIRITMSEGGPAVRAAGTGVNTAGVRGRGAAAGSSGPGNSSTDFNSQRLIIKG
ncbi:MAG TPA: glycoside hydrolase N-terminal domain-containing protein, partial [Bacteroidales bacterium]|nr:glycoside hydrolase N-terminal domain-containing protein [Bacteroidales bacterium]